MNGVKKTMFKQKQQLVSQQLDLDYMASKQKDTGSEEQVNLNYHLMRIVDTFPQIMAVKANPGD